MTFDPITAHRIEHESAHPLLAPKPKRVNASRVVGIFRETNGFQEFLNKKHPGDLDMEVFDNRLLVVFYYVDLVEREPEYMQWVYDVCGVMLDTQNHTVIKHDDLEGFGESEEPFDYVRCVSEFRTFHVMDLAFPLDTLRSAIARMIKHAEGLRDQLAALGIPTMEPVETYTGEKTPHLTGSDVNFEWQRVLRLQKLIGQMEDVIKITKHTTTNQKLAHMHKILYSY